MLTRRSILRGLIAAPAIVSAGSIMPVKLGAVAPLDHYPLLGWGLPTELYSPTAGAWITWSDLAKYGRTAYDEAMNFNGLNYRV
jgi:hypothetical protein